MAAVTWKLWPLCAMAVHLSSSSSVPSPPLVVGARQSVLLSCNLTSCKEVTWFVVHSDSLLPLLTIRSSKVDTKTVDRHNREAERFSAVGELEDGGVSLEILQAEEGDSGLYFCSESCGGAVRVQGIHVVVGDSTGAESARQPCWSVGICVLPASFVIFVFTIFVGWYLCSGKPVVCCCSAAGNAQVNVSEEESLHYSGLKLRPAGPQGRRLVGEEVTYSAVKLPNGARSKCPAVNGYISPDSV